MLLHEKHADKTSEAQNEAVQVPSSSNNNSDYVTKPVSQLAARGMSILPAWQTQGVGVEDTLKTIEPSVV